MAKKGEEIIQFSKHCRVPAVCLKLSQMPGILNQMKSGKKRCTLVPSRKCSNFPSWYTAPFVFWSPTTFAASTADCWLPSAWRTRLASLESRGLAPPPPASGPHSSCCQVQWDSLFPHRGSASASLSAVPSLHSPLAPSLWAISVLAYLHGHKISKMSAWTCLL